MSKRGSLSLSINAVVVLILAIAILGVGIGFVRGQFTDMEKQFSSIQDDVQKELTDKIRISGELVTFNKINIEVLKGVESMFYIGIKNPDSADKCFEVMVGCVKAMTGGSCTVEGDRVKVGGSMPDGYAYGISSETWFKMFTDVEISSGEVGVYPIYIQIPLAHQESYQMELMVFKSISGRCSDAVWDDKVFQAKTFYMTVR